MQLIKHAKVLLVDDSLVDISVMERTIRKCMPSVLVHSVNDGEQAIAYLSRELPDLILMDIRMPRMDGIQALTLIKQNPLVRHVPIVMMSTSDDPDGIELCYKAHANAYVTKRFHRTKQQLNPLEQMIRFWLEVSELPSRSTR